MERRFTFRLARNIEWRSPSRALLLLAALALATRYGFAWWVVVLLGALFVTFFVELPHRRSIAVSYWLFALSSAAGAYLIGHAPMEALGALPVALVATLTTGAVLIAILRSGQAPAGHQPISYAVLGTVIMFTWLLTVEAVGSHGPAVPSPLAALAVFVSVTLLLREAFLSAGAPPGRRTWVAAAAAGLAAAELQLVLTFLPLGPINTAAFLTLFSFLARDSLVAHFRGTLDLTGVLRSLTVLVVLTMLIFAASRWSV